MLLRTKGIARNIEAPIVGRITRDPNAGGNRRILVCEEGLPAKIPHEFDCILTKVDPADSLLAYPAISKVPDFGHLQDGDIVVVGTDGNIRTLYRVNSIYNTLVATERCNSNCLMCSQPPRDRDDIPRLFSIYEQLIPLIPKNCSELLISGGEPTLMGDRFFRLLEIVQTQLPDTEVHVLTNGRSFAWNNMAERLAALDFRRLMLGIPVYSDYYQLHDYIVQARDAFHQTILGLHNLARYQQRIEIRIVLHAQTIPRLTRLARFIYKNLPFAEQVVFMGLEYVGYTPHNFEKLWIDPWDYRDELSEAAEYLAGHGMKVSIYNTPLCILPRSTWQYAKKSISDWKQSYLPECAQCTKLDECGGFFTWNLNKPSAHICPFT